MPKKKETRPVCQRGYKSVRERVDKYPKVFMSCMNCDYYFQAVGDKEEVCQNNEVLEYDMVVEENRVYCLRWHQFQGHKKASESDVKSYANRICQQGARRIFKNQRP